MTEQLRAELHKHRSTFTNLSLFSAMLGLVLLAVLLHALSLPANRLDTAAEQVQVFRFGPLLGALFAGLAGALSITGEIRHGTIRPTFLITPRRGRVVAAKIVAGGVVGIVFGLAAVGAAIGVGSAALAARGIPITLDGGDYTLMPIGGIAGAVLWAAIGLGLGALLRNQVATLVTIFLWLFFVENLLLDFLPGVGRLAPGAAAAAITGLDGERLLAAVLGALLLAGCAAAVWPWSWSPQERRHHELTAIWAEARGDPDTSVPWDRYAAWADADGDHVELVLVRLAGTTDDPSPLSAEVVRRLDPDDVAGAASAMEQLRERATAMETRAREQYLEALTAAERRAHEEALRDVDAAADEHRRQAEEKMRRDLAADEAAERQAQAAAVARALRRR